jgi:hypothetical protein
MEPIRICSVEVGCSTSVRGDPRGVTALAFGVDQIEEFENENIHFSITSSEVGFLIQQRLALMRSIGVDV